MAEYKTPDEETKARDHYEEMSGMRFRSVKIQFYPEDLAKMETMEHENELCQMASARESLCRGG